MHLRGVLLSLVLAVIASPAWACKENSDCRKPGTRCVKAAYYSYCGPWQAKDAPQPKTWETGPPAGESCQTDRDCRNGKACKRPNQNAHWRCVAR